MGEAAGTPVTGMERLPEDTVATILLRLPSKSVLRSGAVCKAWRRITTAPHFLVAHAQRRCRPAASIIVCTDLDGSPWPDLGLDAVPVSCSSEDDDDAAGRHRLVRYPNTPLCIQPHCLLLASCDGVLLFGTGAGGYILCNPVMRRWAEMPRLPADYSKEIGAEYAFYLHRPSGEFRLLCCSLRRRVWYVVSTGGGAEPRDLKASNADDPSLLTRFIDSLFMTTATPVALHSNLHWPPLRRRAGGGETTTIKVFDTLSETFHQMPGPASWTPKRLKLFEMGGLLAAADFGEEEHVDLWVLEDYGAGRWARRHRVASPWKHGKGRPRSHSGMQSVVAAGDGEGNVILGNSKGLAVYDTRRRETMAVRRVDSVMPREFVSRHVFKGSNIEHACVATAPSGDLPFIHSSA